MNAVSAISFIFAMFSPLKSTDDDPMAMSKAVLLRSHARGRRRRRIESMSRVTCWASLEGLA